MRYDQWDLFIEVHYFHVKIVDGDRHIQDPDQLIYDIDWKTLNEIRTLNLSFPEDRDFLIECMSK